MRLGRDIELQNTHIVLFKSPRGGMQTKNLNQQLGLGSQLKKWYTKATSIPYGHLLIDLTIDSVRTKNVKTVFWQLVKFGTEISIWTKLIKSFITEDELDMETLFWVFS